MSDWKQRAKKVEPTDAEMPDWKRRAVPVRDPSVMEHPAPAIEEGGGDGLIGALSAAAKQAPQVADAGLQGFGQGASFGFSDELAGALASGAKFAAPGLEYLPQLFDPSLTPQEMAYRLYGTQEAVPYRAARDASRRDVKQAQEEHPAAFLGGALAGGLITPGPKGLGAARLAKQGALLGAASGAGMSDADLLEGEVGGALADTALGGVTGGVMTPVASGLTARLGNWLRKASQENALKAVGARAGISNSLAKMGYETADDARELGQRALDMELISPFGKAEGVAERAGFAKQVQGTRIGQVLDDADAAGIPFDADEAAWAAAMRAAGPQGLSPTAAREATRGKRLVGDVLALPESQAGATFGSANRLKSDMYQGINYSTDPALKTQIERRAASGLRSSIEDQLERGLGTEAADELRAANAAYGSAADIEALARDEATRQLQRKTLTPLDIASALGVGAAGTAAGSTAGGALGGAAVLGARLAGPRIPSTLAVGQRALSRLPMLPAMEGAVRATRTTLTEREQAAIDAFMSSK